MQANGRVIDVGATEHRSTTQTRISLLSLVSHLLHTRDILAQALSRVSSAR